MNFNEQKATAVASILLEKAGGELGDLKLMKLMYLAEREMIRRTNTSITGDTFFSLQNGPVLSQTLNLMRGQAHGTSGEFWNEHIENPKQWVLKLKKAATNELLSEAEQQIVEAQWVKHGKTHKWDLVDLTHTFPEWDERAKQFNTSIAIPMIDIFEALEIPKDTIESRLAEIQAADYFEDLLKQASAGTLKGIQ